jgi:hypothetical protein
MINSSTSQPGCDSADSAAADSVFSSLRTGMMTDTVVVKEHSLG